MSSEIPDKYNRRTDMRTTDEIVDDIKKKRDATVEGNQARDLNDKGDRGAKAKKHGDATIDHAKKGRRW